MSMVSCRTVVVLAAVAIALSACGKDDEKDVVRSGNAGTTKATTKKYGAGDPEGCERFADRELGDADSKIPRDADPALRAQLQEMNRELRRVLTIRCVTDGWAAEAIECGVAAKLPQIECFPLLSSAHRKKVEDELQASVMAILSRPAR